MTSGSCRNGVLPQRPPHRLGKAGDIGAHFALGHQATFVVMAEFDWVLDGHDVPAHVGVDPIHHRGQGRALAGTRGTCHQNQAAGPLKEFYHRRLRQPDLGEVHQFPRDATENGRVAPLLPHHTGPETLAAGMGDAEVGGAIPLHLVPLLVAAQRAAHTLGGLGVPDLLCERFQLAAHPDDRRTQRVDVEVGSSGSDAPLKQGGDRWRHCGRTARSLRAHASLDIRLGGHRGVRGLRHDRRPRHHIIHGHENSIGSLSPAL